MRSLQSDAILNHLIFNSYCTVVYSLPLFDLLPHTDMSINRLCGLKVRWEALSSPIPTENGVSAQRGNFKTFIYEERLCYNITDH